MEDGGRCESKGLATIRCRGTERVSKICSMVFSFLYMNNTLKVLAGTLIGSTLTFGGSKVFGGETDTAAIQSQKDALAKQYVYAQVRLNEIPTLDLSIISVDEMTKAYSDLANEKGALAKDNLFDGLHDKAVQDGVACK